MWYNVCMKENYQKKMEYEIAHMAGIPRLLLQCCCGPCSTSVLEQLTRHFSVTVLFYNPNIRPEAEYIRRLDTFYKLLRELPVQNSVSIIECDWRPEDFDAVAAGLEQEPEGGRRCVKCIALRMEEAAKTAAELGFDWFCTTLSVSPHKNAEMINALGENLEKKYGVRWLPSDFKKKDGYLRSIRMSQEYGLYRQNYCGCGYGVERE